MHYAVIGEDTNPGNINITGPASHDGNGYYPLEINWDIPEARPGDVSMAVLSLVICQYRR